MSYKIQYAPEAVRKYPLEKSFRKIRWGNLFLFLAVILTALYIRVNGVPDFLIPGDPNVTKAAVATMVTQIRSGDTVNEAVTVFCKEILDGAQFESIP